MSVETFKIMLDKMLNHVGEQGSISIIYHGGEPLLRGLEFYKDVTAIINERGGRKRIDACIQTNGTLINEKFAEFIVENNIPCGISLDGPKEIHDANRVQCKSKRGTFEKVMKGIQALRAKGRNPSAIVVLTKASLPKMREIYNFFNSEGLDFKVNPVDLIGRSKAERDSLEITPVEYGQALVELFDLWFNDKQTKIHIGNLFDAMSSLTKGFYNECIFSNRACGGSYIGLTPNGDVYPCNRFSSYPNFKMGNIVSDEIPEIFGNQIFTSFGRRSDSLQMCASCEYRPFCNGGCSSRAYSYHNSINERDFYCPSIKMIFGHITKALESEININGGTYGN